MERGAERFFADVAPQPLQPDDTPAVYLRRRVRESAEVFATHPEFWRLFVLLMLSNDNPDVTEIVQRVRDHGRGSLQRSWRPPTAPPVRRWRSGSQTNPRLRARRIRRHVSGDAGLPQRSVERLVDQVAESLIHLADDGLLSGVGWWRRGTSEFASSRRWAKRNGRRGGSANGDLVDQPLDGALWEVCIARKVPSNPASAKSAIASATLSATS